MINISIFINNRELIEEITIFNTEMNDLDYAHYRFELKHKGSIFYTGQIKIEKFKEMMTPIFILNRCLESYYSKLP